MSIERQDDDELLKAYNSLKPQKKAADGDAKETPELLEAEFIKAQESIRRLVNVKDEPSGTDKALFLYAVEKSLVHLAGYASLNYEHVRKLVDLQTAVANYDKATSGKQADDIRPLNWLITSNPGEGKSHLASCIAKAPVLKDKVSLVSYNMANMRTADDLIHALDEVRNVSVTGKLPMLFLDEIDTKDENFGLLLPLLWDGQIQVGINRIRIGRAVIVAAGSKPYLVRRKDKDTNLDKDKKPPDKLRDFISRITFETAIPPLAPNHPGGIDQVCIAIAILRNMYNTESVTKEYDMGYPTKKKKTELLSVPVRLLNFIYRTHFYYGVRSITHFLEHLMNLDDKKKDIDDKGVLKIERLERALSTPELAAKSGLLAHIREDDRAENEEAQLEGLVAHWAESKGFSGNAPIWSKTFTELKRPSDWPEDRAEFYNAQLSREQSGAEWHKFVGAGIDNVGVLYFFPDLGVWLHGKGRGLRHIFFNLNTIAAIIHRLDPADLYLVGHEMGKAFGSDFFVNSLKLEMNVRSVDMKYAIEKWCKFDVSGGWGLWGQTADEAEKVGGNITVENSFFVAEVEDQIRKGLIKKEGIKKGDHAPHCAIMQGYIAGVLEAFSAQLGPSHKFEVEERRCGIEDLKAEQDPKCKCTFRWKERPAKRPSQEKSHRRPARGKAPNIRRG